MPRVTIRPLSDLSAVLPILASNLSMSRAHLVIDQLRSLIARQRSDEIVLLIGNSEKGEPEGVRRTQDDHQRDAGVVIHHPRGADFATMFLAGWTTNATDQSRQDDSIDDGSVGEAARAIGSVLDPLMHQRGVRFLQFATDVEASVTNGDSNSLAFRWQQGLGFQHIANLRYQSGSTEDAAKILIEEDRPSRITLRPIGEFGAFALLVQRTYVQTLDCPVMNQFRNAQQTIAGYRQNDAYHAELWFTAHASVDESESATTPLGCLVMGLHRTDLSEEHTDHSDEHNGKETSSPPIAELVYMGLLPESRGQGFGRDLLHEAAKVAQRVGAERMILAVDETNHPARELYRRAGMKTMMRESVWAKAIDE